MHLSEIDNDCALTWTLVQTNVRVFLDAKIAMGTIVTASLLMGLR